MGSPAPTTQTITRRQLVLALDRLQSTGLWSPDQVSALLAEIDRTTPVGAATPVAAAAGAPVARVASPRGNRLAEAAAYAGAVLVGAAAAVFVGQNWAELGRPGRVAVLAAVAVLLGVVGAVVAAVPPRGREVLCRPEHAVRRRLASTALTIATATAAGAAAVLATGHQALVAGFTAVVVIAVVQWLVPSAVSETVALAAVLLLTGAVLAESDASTAVVMVAIAAVGLAWAAASRSRMITLPTLAVSLGLLVALYAGAAGTFGGPDTAARNVGLVLLGLLAAGGLALYVRSAVLAPAVVGVLALAALVLRITSDSLGPVLAVFLTGLVLLGVGAALLLRRRTSAR